MAALLCRGHKAQPRTRERRRGGRSAYSGKWSDEDDVVDHLNDLPPWQALQVWAHLFVEASSFLSGPEHV